jgi:AcrR family transcriptional regulator
MTTGSVSPRRADTRRNHELILAAAARSLAATGAVSFNAIAKQAGVGVGTVYRHFPTPEDLILAVYDREVTHLVEVVPQLLAEHDPERAFRLWVTDHLAHYMMTKRGLANALSATRSELPSSAYERMFEALTSLLEANAAAGTIRSDVAPETVLRGLGGLFFLDPGGDWKTQTADLTNLLWQGMSA